MKLRQCLPILALLASAGDLRAQAAAPQGTPPSSVRERAELALQRDPRRLPRSEKGRWAQWGPKDPLAPELQSDLASAMRAYAAQDYAASLAFLHALLEREHDFPPALYQGGLCYFRLRRYGDGAVLFERFVEVAPQEIGASQALGHCYYSLGDYAGARDHYQLVLAQAPDSPEALRGLALSELRLGNSARALEILRRVLELRPEHGDAHAWCAQILFDEGESEAALVHAERSRELEPWEPRPWFLLSRIYTELERDEDAARSRERFEHASRVDQQIRQQEGLLLHHPASADIWVQLVALQRSVENRPAARRALVHLEALAPRDTRTALFLVDGYEWLGERERAVAAARQVEIVAASDPEAWAWLAAFYRRIGDATSLERAERAQGSLRKGR